MVVRNALLLAVCITVAGQAAKAAGYENQFQSGGGKYSEVLTGNVVVSDGSAEVASWQADAYVGSCGKCDNDDRHRCSCRSTCDMIPHIPYFPEYHGNYYFRPYSYHHVLMQKEIVKSWGGDPRHPYANDLFKKIYEETGSQNSAFRGTRTPGTAQTYPSWLE